MNLQNEILKEHSKPHTLKIARWVGSDKKRFAQLMELFLHGEYRVTQRAAWIVCHCADLHPELIKPWLKRMIEKTKELGVHDAVPRNVLRIVSRTEIPAKLLGTVTTLCFDLLSIPASPIAVKAYAMTILQKVVRREPDLKNELYAVIESAFGRLPHMRPALKVRSREMMKELGKKRDEKMVSTS